MIEFINKCQCGAVTATIDGRNYSMPVSEFERLYGSLTNFSDVTGETEYNNCNYCVNGWGIDLCACGSGEKVDECNCEFDCNGKPSQIIGERTHYNSEDGWIV